MVSLRSIGHLLAAAAPKDDHESEHLVEPPVESVCHGEWQCVPLRQRVAPYLEYVEAVAQHGANLGTRVRLADRVVGAVVHADEIFRTVRGRHPLTTASRK